MDGLSSSDLPSADYSRPIAAARLGTRSTIRSLVYEGCRFPQRERLAPEWGPSRSPQMPGHIDLLEWRCCHEGKAGNRRLFCSCFAYALAVRPESRRIIGNSTACKAWSHQ